MDLNKSRSHSSERAIRRNVICFVARAKLGLGGGGGGGNLILNNGNYHGLRKLREIERSKDDHQMPFNLATLTKHPADVRLRIETLCAAQQFKAHALRA